MSFALDAAFLLTASAHVLLSPYTKVEESFNLHAIHDIFFHGWSPQAIQQFDHVVFPGAVPRSFIPSFALAWVLKPIAQTLATFGLVHSKLDLQVLARLTLAISNAIGLIALRRATTRRFGRLAGFYFTLLSCTQFHIPYWMGRTIPNMFAFLPVNIALAILVGRAPQSFYPSRSSVHAASFLLIFASIVIRAEIAILAALIMIQAWVSGHSSFAKLFKVGLAASLVSIVSTVLVDSYFWQQSLLWPEFESIFFNIWEGKSADWGVSPFSAYFTAHAPKLLLASLPLSIVGFILDSRVQAIMLPALLYMLTLSFLGHKEWRFIVYIVPMFNIAAAVGAKWMSSRPKSRLFGQLSFLAVLGLLMVNVLATVFFTKASVINYPGGEALATFNAVYDGAKNVHVHISNLAAQTGASLFLHAHAPPFWLNTPQHIWTYDKTESLSTVVLDSDVSITHLIAEVPVAHSSRHWNIIQTISGFGSMTVDWDLLRNSGKELLDKVWNGVRMIPEERLVILERR